MTPGRSIAVAQTIPMRGDVAANVAQHLRLVQVAAEKHAQVLIFPELSLTGYELDVARALAFSERDARLAPLAEAAARQSITLVVGAPVERGARLHIGAFIVSPSGAISLYTKHHLGAFAQTASCDGIVPPAEATVFHAGTENPLVRINGSITAVAVCADTGRPTHAQVAADRGARTYLASMFVIPSEFERETLRLSAYAKRHAMVVAFANYGGPSGGLASGGRSAIWADNGELVAQLETSGTGVAVATEGDDGWRGKTVMRAA